MKTINAKQLRTVTILVRYTVKATGTVILHVENDKGVRYFCTLNENGTKSCSCPATKECYHLKAVVKVEEARKAEWIAYRQELAKKLAAQYVTTQVVEQVAEKLVESKSNVKSSNQEVTPLKQWIDNKLTTEEFVKKTPDIMKAALTTNKGFSLLR